MIDRRIVIHRWQTGAIAPAEMSTPSAQILEKIQESAVVAIYDKHTEAEEAVRDLSEVRV